MNLRIFHSLFPGILDEQMIMKTDKDPATVKRMRLLTRGSSVVLIVLAIISNVLLFVFHAADMVAVNAFTIGMEAFSILLAAVLYYSYMQDPDSVEEHTILFTLLIVADTFGLCLDQISWMVQGVPSLAVVNKLSNVLLFMDNGFIIYMFWLYAAYMLGIKGDEGRTVKKLLKGSIVFIFVISILNLFVPILFSVDSAGVYRREKLFPLGMISLVIVLPSLIKGVITFKGPKKEKKIISLFLLLPLFSSGLSVVSFGISTQYCAVLLSILLVVGVTVSDRNKKMTATRTELDTAMRIQESLLPGGFSDFGDDCGFTIYASMDPAKEVGGDFFDFFMIDDDHLAVVIADVSDKGVPAALFMSSAKTLIGYRARHGGTPAEIFTEVNKELCRNNAADMFVTVWMGILNVHDGTLICCNAGHEYPAIRDKDGRFRLMHDRHSLALGAMTGVLYQDYTVQLQPEDMIFVYTDGVPEANNVHKEMYGADRMEKALNRIQDLSPKGVLKGIREDVDLFTEGAAQFDDMTMLCVKYTGE